MKTTALICPRCKAELDLDSVDKHVKYVKCPYCNLYVSVTDENVKTVNINKTVKKETFNYAKIAEFEYKKQKEKNDHLLIIVAAIILIGSFIGIPAAFYIVPKYNAYQAQKHIEAAAERGLICAGNASDYRNKQYDIVVEQLKGKGFRNISTEYLSGIFNFLRSDNVEKVSINGNTEFTYSDYFDPYAKVVIFHH